MFRKFAIGLAFIITALCGAFLVGCGTVDYDKKFSDKAKVVFELEGGKYLNSTTSVSHYYTLEDGKPCKIVALEDIPEGELTRDGGFVLEGWYRTKSGDGVYSDRWNFATDTVTKDGVTLYANWNAPIEYTFEFVYVDDSGVEHTAGSYKVNAGNKFGDVYRNDVLTYANGYAGHTAIAVYYDAEHKIPFDDSVTHPGGEESTAVKLYVEYIEGSYTIVRTATQLSTAPRTRGIYLLDDIDMEGKSLSFNDFSGRTFIGNGHKISNFTVSYTASRNYLVEDFEDESKQAFCISLFGNVDGAKVVGVTFENMRVVVDSFLSGIDKIYVAPLAVSAKNSTFEDVTVTGTFGYTQRTTTEISFISDRGVGYGDNTAETNCRYEITLAGQVEK